MADISKISDLDPIFIKAIKLLHSKNKDSTDHLKELLDTAIQYRRSELKIKNYDYDNFQSRSKSYLKKEICSKKRESENNFENINLEDQSIKDMPPLKKFRSIEINNFKDENAFSKNIPNQNKLDIPELINVMSSSCDVDLNTSSTGLSYDDHFDLDLDNISCIICRDITVTASNRLVECQECHNLYHQYCHQPKVVDDVNDPRFIWYCHKCFKNMKKIISTKAVVKKIIKPISNTGKTFDNVQPFRRISENNKGSSISNSISKNVSTHSTKLLTTSSTSEMSKIKADSSKLQNKIIRLDAKSSKSEIGVKSFASQLASLTIFPVTKSSKIGSVSKSETESKYLL